MQIITVISQACDMARRKFSRGEQFMLIDIFNSTALIPGILGQYLIAQVEDSFDFYPGLYEEKWGVDKTEMLQKIQVLTTLDAIFLELWCVSFWAINEPGRPMEDYIAGKSTLSEQMHNIITQLNQSAGLLEKTKVAFKSGQVAEARNIIEKTKNKLESLL